MTSTQTQTPPKNPKEKEKEPCEICGGTKVDPRCYPSIPCECLNEVEEDDE